MDEFFGDGTIAGDCRVWWVTLLSSLHSDYELLFTSPSSLVGAFFVLFTA